MSAMMPRNRVLFVLLLAGIAAASGLAFLTVAPNRLASGRAIGFAAAHGVILLGPGLLLGLAAFLPQRRQFQALTAAAAFSFLLLLVWLCGSDAARLAAGAAPAFRVSPGGGFWALLLISVLALSDALRRLDLPLWAGALLGTALVGAVLLLLISGRLDALAIIREYAARREIFAAAVLRHMLMVGLALAATVLVGVPLGIAAERRPGLAAGLFPVLNVVQTIPSIALFGLLLAPLSALARLFPALAAAGIGGVGLLPAVIALFLYALLPVVRDTAEGVGGVSRAAVEAGRGLGMTPHELLWRVELPLALPVILSGLRVATLQAIGLAAVAALIGAGGLGAIMFQGLFADALDLVLLGVVPIVLLALTANLLFELAIAYAERAPR